MKQSLAEQPHTKHIKVWNSYPYKHDVTVQIIENEVMVECNHAGAQPGLVVIDRGDDDEIQEGILCNRCPAWSYDGEDWNDD